MNEPPSVSGGIGFTGLLAILFIGLKLTGTVDWSWWWVLAPLWAPLALFLLVAAIVWLVMFGRGIRELG